MGGTRIRWSVVTILVFRLLLWRGRRHDPRRADRCRRAARRASAARSAAWPSIPARSGPSGSRAPASRPRSSASGAKIGRWTTRTTITTRARPRPRPSRPSPSRPQSMCIPSRTRQSTHHDRTGRWPRSAALIDGSALSAAGEGSREAPVRNGLGEAEAAIHGTSLDAGPSARGRRARFDHRHRRHRARAGSARRRPDRGVAAECRQRQRPLGARAVSGAGTGDSRGC